MLFWKRGNLKSKMKKIRISFLLTFMMLLLGCTGTAQPLLSNVQADTEFGEHWTIWFESSEGGTAALLFANRATGQSFAPGAVDMDAGRGSIQWDGVLPDNSLLPDGAYDVTLRVRNFWGEENNAIMMAVVKETGTLAMPQKTEADSGEERLDLSLLLGAEEVQEWSEAETSVVASAEDISPAVPVASSFWDMDPDAYDLENPEHQKAIWDLMMQPITVLDVGQTEHVYPTNAPGLNRTPYEQNTAGELHGQSQGVHVLEDDLDGDGYVLIEAFSNDGTKTDNAYMESIDNKRIQGYVKKSLLLTKTPSQKYALLIDKLRQKLYIFEAGAIIGTLDVSTGLNNAKQPYNESPAGEFITVSKVGEFISGTMRAQFAIRINGGTLLHEVPYRYGGDGKTKIYSEFEPELGKKASHGCIRIQRRKNDAGQNMQWLWDNLELKTRVFIWDDQGRHMYEPELPDAALPLYRNPNGGTNYHLDPNCSGVKAKFLPLTGDFTYGDLTSGEFAKLTPCTYCGAPVRPETLYERYMFEAAQVGDVLDETEVKQKFGLLK